MGRRKERRIAATAGRRVKLDLFAEPTGDLGGSSAQEEVGGDDDSKTRAELHVSPSSSEKQPQNPLLLLGQYSDDELDEGSNEGHNRAVEEDAPIDIDDKDRTATGKETEYNETNLVNEPEVQNVEELPMDVRSAPQDPSQNLQKGSIKVTDSDVLQGQQNKMEEATCPAASDENLGGDVSSGWQMVLHEESNQYYYWNIVTGETSWEVPDGLVPQAVTAEKVVGDAEGKLDSFMDTYKPSMLLDMEENDITIKKSDADSRLNCQKSDVQFGADSVNYEDANKDASHTNGTSLLGGHSVESKSGTDLPLKLMKHCESLLERLNCVKGLSYHLGGQDLAIKFTLEAEVRLADIKALASHGSSLLPFWLHYERQLKQLEASIDGVIQHNNSTLSGVEATLESCEAIGSEGIGNDTEIDSSTNEALLAAVESHVECMTKIANFEAHNDGATTAGHLPSTWYSSTDSVKDVGEENGITGTEKESELTPEPGCHFDEDVDMDVDMEVEETPSINLIRGDASDVHCLVSPELSNIQTTLADQEPEVPGQVFSVPPPVEQWVPPPPPDSEPVPPPPPDDEPFPPPPPDEPPETSYPTSSDLGSAQSFPYPGQYTVSYSGSNLEYYGQTNLEVPGTTFYVNPEGSHVAVSHLPQYYESVSNMYTVAPVIVNPVEPTAYYGLQNGTVNNVSLISAVAEPSGIQNESVPETKDSGTAGSMDSHPEDGSNLLENTNNSVIKSGYRTVKGHPGVPEDQSFTGDPTSSTMNGVSVSSTSGTTTSVSTAAAAAAAATSKPQSKVTRTKKRTVAVVSSLRSNKKVSSLVDKWKAVKEELHEEEEEPKDAYEILEKKRQREIEEWRAHQIASGEAKDNANFQPLGGNWRERVKRRRAEKMKETEQSSPDVATDGIQPTDLTELSNGLPSGWRVYWDVSTKQVYYGNVLTSETTWSRPTA